MSDIVESSFSPFGKDLFGEPIKQKAAGPLAERFLFPPFTILDARQGEWQERKRAWLEFGVKIGTEMVDAVSPNSLGEKAGRCARIIEEKKSTMANISDGMSLELAERFASSGCASSGFDPVLAEVCFKWFCPKGGHVLDPFAGESTKGIVATSLGYGYTGTELRQAQVDENNQSAEKVGLKPNWICGDSSKIDSLLPVGETYDFVFTSPPYYDLEIYSKSDKDGSAFETYGQFMDWYCDIFRQAVGRVKNNRFVCVKIGEVRDEKGIFRNFLGDNINCFLKLGLKYYNEAVLITPCGSLPIRAGKAFAMNRKLGKTHQNILVFLKGDPKEIRNNFEQETND